MMMINDAYNFPSRINTVIFLLGILKHYISDQFLFFPSKINS